MKEKYYKSGLVFICLCLLITTAAKAQDNTSDMLKIGRDLFFKSTLHEDYIPRALNLFEMIRDKELQGRTTTYMGALTAMKAKYAFWPHDKLKWANRGLDMLDAGIAKSPDDIEALFIHGTTCYYLPFFFNRRDDAERSFRKIIELLPQHVEDYDPELVKNVVQFIRKHVPLDASDRHKLQQIEATIANFDEDRVPDF